MADLGAICQVKMKKPSKVVLVPSRHHGTMEATKHAEKLNIRGYGGTISLILKGVTN